MQAEKEFLKCNHTRNVTEEYVRNDKQYNTVIESNKSGLKIYGKSIWDNKYFINILRTIGGVLLVFCFIFICIFLKEILNWLSTTYIRRGAKNRYEGEMHQF